MVTLGLVSSSLPSASPKAICTPDYRVGRRLGREGGTILCVCVHDWVGGQCYMGRWG
jgi:hypothetical protein